jgi:hypothetical protein
MRDFWKKPPTPENLAKVTETELRALELEVASSFTESCFRDAIRNGDVVPTGKSDLELKCELLKYTLDRLDSIKLSGKVHWVIDHTKNLLEAARHSRQKCEEEIAVLLYATWSEHWLNSVIVTACQRKKLTEDHIEQLIRDTPFRGKHSWLLRLLDLPPIPATTVAKLTELQNLRNGFVHYKFRPEEASLWDLRAAQLERVLIRAEKMVRALTRYEDSFIFQRGRTKAERLARTVLFDSDPSTKGGPSEPRESAVPLRRRMGSGKKHAHGRTAEPNGSRVEPPRNRGFSRQ